MVDRCVCCGDVIPEGRQVCYICENSVNEKNHDKKLEIKTDVSTGKIRRYWKTIFSK